MTEKVYRVWKVSWNYYVLATSEEKAMAEAQKELGRAFNSFVCREIRELMGKPFNGSNLPGGWHVEKHDEAK